MLCVTSGFTIAAYLLIYSFKRFGKLEWATYMCVPYLVLHTTATVFCYKGWLAPRLTIPDKDIFDF